jgi:hypothetical protein
MSGSTKHWSFAEQIWAKYLANLKPRGEAKMKTKPWREIRARRFSAQKLKEIDRAVEYELLEIDLRELREATGKTQEELAEALKKAQSGISRIESRSDYRLSNPAAVRGRSWW